MEAAPDLSRIDHARDWILSRTVLAGVEVAYKERDISREEYDGALSFLSTKDASIFTGLQVGFFSMSRAADGIAAGFYSKALLNDSSEDILGIIAAHQLGPTVLRGGLTLAAGAIAGKDLKKMSMQSMIPIVGAYIAIPRQIVREYGDNADLIQRSSRRLVASKVSRLMRRGGWGSDTEQRLTRNSYKYENQMSLFLIERAHYFSAAVPG